MKIRKGQYKIKLGHRLEIRTVCYTDEAEFVRYCLINLSPEDFFKRPNKKQGRPEYFAYVGGNVLLCPRNNKGAELNILYAEEKYV